MPYIVMVADNFHYGDEDDHHHAGEFATVEEAISRCKKIVDESLAESAGSGRIDSAKALYEHYTSFGEDPFIVDKDGPPIKFSAWDYAKQRCEELCREAPRIAPDPQG